MEDRVKAIEAKLAAVIHFLGWVGVISILNLGATLWYFQLSDDVDWNFVAVTLTIFEVFLVIALAGGFWMLRGAAQSAAEAEAKKVAEPVAYEVARRTALQYSGLAENVARQASKADSRDLENMIESLSDQNGGPK
jgi:hypothetical protein